MAKKTTGATDATSVATKPEQSTKKAAAAPSQKKPQRRAKAAPAHPPFGEWRKEGKKWIHFGGDHSVFESRLVNRRHVKGACKEFPDGQLIAMETQRRDDFLHQLLKEATRAKSDLFTRIEEE